MTAKISRLLIQIVVCLCRQKYHYEMNNLFHPVLIIEYFLVYVKPKHISGNLLVWKYCSQTTNHGSKISQNKAVTLEIMPAAGVKNMVSKIANQCNKEMLSANYRNVVLMYSRQH